MFESLFLRSEIIVKALIQVGALSQVVFIIIVVVVVIVVESETSQEAEGLEVLEKCLNFSLAFLLRGLHYLQAVLLVNTSA